MMQSDVEPLSKIWHDFSRAFLSGGLLVDSSRKQFPGIASGRVKPSSAHMMLADALRNGTANVISLIFDGLTYRALTSRHRPGVVLHSIEEIEKYYCADIHTFIPSIIKIRGDVFYAICEEQYCPLNLRPYPLDRLRNVAKDDVMRCPSCGAKKLKLQFSFPGFRYKEEIAGPMLAAARQFLGPRTSAIILVGLSGRWDRYLLQFIFQLAKDRSLLVADVKLPDGDSTLIDHFRSTYFPSVSVPSSTTPDRGSTFVRVHATADDFLDQIKDIL
ncbi:MAG: FmdB family zinc ribbon protein [Sulfobacillus sp.]